ncbi:MAG: flavin reductase family protein [Dietzia sp.]|uniref:flavin reductase family protein n=1 Tax=Dietzia sp. TaxID=1871616 RepID=UPI00271574FE|nr:flavin reductase family protein [Dietzia sp.]MDO8394507.1 flavin reductase family protein [Dietzia sp.]
MTERSLSTAHQSVPAETHRRAMRMHPAGVTIITLDGADGPVGFTASSPSSLSSRPALVSFNVGISSSSLAAVLDARTAVIHLLGEADRPRDRPTTRRPPLDERGPPRVRAACPA